MYLEVTSGVRSQSLRLVERMQLDGNIPKKGGCKGVPKSSTDSLQDIDRLLIIHARKTNGEQQLGEKMEQISISACC